MYYAVDGKWSAGIASLSEVSRESGQLGTRDERRTDVAEKRIQ